MLSPLRPDLITKSHNEEISNDIINQFLGADCSLLLQAGLQSISFQGCNKVIELRNELIEEILELGDCFDSLQVHSEFPEW